MGINQYIKIGTRIKEARLAKKIPQKEMARRLSLSVSTYSNYENNYREPKLDLIHRICDELDTNLDELLGTSSMSPELRNEVSKHLLKDDVTYVKKELNDIFQKQLDGMQTTEDKINFFNNFIYGYLERNNIVIDSVHTASNTNNALNIHTDGIDWELKKIFQKIRRKEEFKEHWERMKEKFSTSAERIQRLQAAYEQLNEAGQEKVTEQIEMLTEIPKYRKDSAE